MAQDSSEPPEVGTLSRGSPGTPQHKGWLTFAGMMFVAAAAVNTVYGIASLFNDDHFRVDELLFGDLEMWGVIYLVFAIVMLITGLAILAGSPVGLIVGGLIALFHGTVALVSIGAYPVWSVIAIVIDGLIIYGLCLQGGEARP